MATSRRLADLIVQNKNQILPVMTNTGEGKTNVQGTDDLVPEYIATMQVLASSYTKDAGNEFPLSIIPSRVHLTDQQGNPVGIRSPGENNQVHYTQQFANPGPEGISGVSLFNQNSNSGQLNVDDSKGGKFVIKKGKSSASGIPTGTQIFQEVNEQGDKSSFVQRIRQVQTDNNRFSPGKSYVPRSGLDDQGLSINTPGSSGSGTVPEDDSNLGVSYVQKEYGKHSPRKFPTTQDSTLLKLKNLKKIGLLTMLEASGEYYIPTDPNDVAQQVAARGASLAPGLARIGQKINTSRISPITIMKNVDPGFEKISLDDNIQKTSVLSYGNVNNWMTPFAGLTSTASIVGAGLLILTVGGLLKGVSVALGAAAGSGNKTSNSPTSNPPSSDRRKKIGSYLGKDTETSAYRNNDIQIEIAQTGHDYFQCVSRGVDIFFGFATPGVQVGKVLNNHGWYNVVLRSLLRNTTDILKTSIGTFVNPEGVQDVNDVTLLGNPLGPLELLQKINNSQLLKFCNVVANIGDIALAHEEAGYQINLDGEVDEWISDMDRIKPEADIGPDGETVLNPSVLQSVQRLPGEYRNALAWGSNTIKSMYMIPEGLIRGQANYIGSQDQSRTSIESLAGDLTINNLNSIKHTSNNRIDAADVAKFEKYLEADYMPFYFHDIRTNEIISFHAFLEETSDGFEAEYTEVEGYGRIGTVPIYKNTKRSISLTFRVVSTNQKDFDHMWWKINKLVTLVYPQYTEGRQVGTATDKFIQPFSQLPSASPMVRIRLGDIWKSNYTKYGVARLFGVGSSQFALQGTEGQFRYNQALQDSRDRVSTRMGNGQYLPGESALLLPLFGVGQRGGQRPVGYPRFGDITDTPGQPGQSRRPGNLSQQGFVSLSPRGSGLPRSINSRGAPLSINHPLRIQITEGPIASTNGTQTNLYKFRVPDGGDGRDGIYVCSQYDLQPNPGEIARIAQGQTASPNAATNTPNTITTFFSPDGENGNTIIKAFETTKGKGLAGFIKSIKFDWSEARWETGRFNSRAPMSLKVSMDFIPIHDINPGIDSDGFMTAPVYNVGDTVGSFVQTPDDQNDNNSTRDAMTKAVANSAPSPGQNIPAV